MYENDLVTPTAKICHSITEIDAADWDRCADGSGVYNPFTRHAFLHALETSGSVGDNTGWQPFHVAVEHGGRLIGVAPMYLKSHSQGEYVFDYAWADACIEPAIVTIQNCRVAFPSRQQLPQAAVCKRWYRR